MSVKHEHDMDFATDVLVKEESLEIGPTLIQANNICATTSTKKADWAEGFDLSKPISCKIIFDDDSEDEDGSGTSDNELLTSGCDPAKSPPWPHSGDDNSCFEVSMSSASKNEYAVAEGPKARIMPQQPRDCAMNNSSDNIKLENRITTSSSELTEKGGVQNTRRIGQYPYNYWSDLIAVAIENSPNKKATVAEIYDYIAKEFPFYIENRKSWKNCVRHTLSLKDCFVKSKLPNRSFHQWTFDPLREVSKANNLRGRRGQPLKIQSHPGGSDPREGYPTVALTRPHVPTLQRYLPFTHNDGTDLGPHCVNDNSYSHDISTSLSNENNLLMSWENGSTAVGVTTENPVDGAPETTFCYQAPTDCVACAICANNENRFRRA